MKLLLDFFKNQFWCYKKLMARFQGEFYLKLKY